MNGNRRYLSPAILQVAGLIILFTSVGFWIISGRESVLLVSASLSLILLGKFGRVIESFTDLGKDSTHSHDDSEKRDQS